MKFTLQCILAFCLCLSAPAAAPLFQTFPLSTLPQVNSLQSTDLITGLLGGTNKNVSIANLARHIGSNAVSYGFTNVAASNTYPASQFTIATGNKVLIKDGASTTNMIAYGLSSAGSIIPLGDNLYQFGIDPTRWSAGWFFDLHSANLVVDNVTPSRPAFINSAGTVTNASGVPDGTKFMRDDGVLAVPGAGQDARMLIIGDSLFAGPELALLGDQDKYFSHYLFTNLAVGGLTTVDMIPILRSATNWLAQTHNVSGFPLRSDSPRYGLVVGGINDIATFTNTMRGIWMNLSNMFASITNVGAIPIATTLWHNVGDQYVEPELNGLIRSNIASFGGILLDLHSVMAPDLPALTYDTEHPSEFGYTYIRRALAEAIRNHGVMVSMTPRGTNSYSMNSPKEFVIESSGRTNLTLTPQGNVRLNGFIASDGLHVNNEPWIPDTYWYDSFNRSNVVGSAGRAESGYLWNIIQLTNGTIDGSSTQFSISNGVAVTTYDKDYGGWALSATNYIPNRFTRAKMGVSWHATGNAGTEQYFIVSINPEANYYLFADNVLVTLRRTSITIANVNSTLSVTLTNMPLPLDVVHTFDMTLEGNTLRGNFAGKPFLVTHPLVGDLSGIAQSVQFGLFSLTPGGSGSATLGWMHYAKAGFDPQPNYEGHFYNSNSLAVATIKASITNGGSWVGMLSNALQVVAMSNNVTSFKILYP